MVSVSYHISYVLYLFTLVTLITILFITKRNFIKNTLQFNCVLFSISSQNVLLMKFQLFIVFQFCYLQPWHSNKNRFLKDKEYTRVFSTHVYTEVFICIHCETALFLQTFWHDVKHETYMPSVQTMEFLSFRK